MPFIVTTKRAVDAVDCGHPEAPRGGWPVLRRAVATAEEARTAAGLAVGQSGGRSTNWTLLYDAAAALGESGGTVGPLPDGTTIEVEPTTISDIADTFSREQFNVMVSDGASDADWVTAFNAREAS